MNRVPPFVLLLIAAALINASDARSQEPAQPNVLVVMTDDQPYGSESRMPILESRTDFVRFSRAFNNNPLCCPARATFLSGQYSHHTGVEDNSQAPDFDASYSLATVFDEAGYETGLFGKYLNNSPFGNGLGWKPPGWDRWVSYADGLSGYYDYELSVDGRLERHGHASEDYSTDVLASYTDEFIRSADTPFFALYTPYGPHGPYTPASRHRDMFGGEHIDPARNFMRNDRSAHPFYKRHRESGMRDIERAQWEALQSEDEALARFMTTLEEQGELDDTIILFTSDNGYSLGAHGWRTKRCLYDECGHLPLAIKAPGLEGGERDALVSNVDFAPTLADLAGLEFTSADGTSLVPILRGEQTTLDRSVLLRSVRENAGDPPTAWGLRTESWKYIAYKSGEVDLFNLDRDPYELRDLAGAEKWLAIRHELGNEMRVLRDEVPGR